MNITVNDLRRIIAEEIQSELNEGHGSNEEHWQEVFVKGKGRRNLLTNKGILAYLRSQNREGYWTEEKIDAKIGSIDDPRLNDWRSSMSSAMKGLGIQRTYNPVRR